MRRPCIAALAGCFWLTALLTVTESGSAQSAPGYQMRPPGVIPLNRGSAPAGVPRLIGTPPTATRHGHGFHHRFVGPFGFFGWYPFGAYSYDDYQDDSVYADDSTTNYTTAESRPGPAPRQDVYVLQDTLPDLGKLVVAFEPAGSKTVVRLTWPDDHHVGATQVAFFLTDSSRSVLSAQTVRAAPFTAVFDPPPATAFTGMTAVLPGGKLVTQYLPFKRRTGSAR